MKLTQQEFKTENEELKNQKKELKKEKENLLNNFRLYLLRGLLLVSRDMKMMLSTFEGDDYDSDEESKEENVKTFVKCLYIFVLATKKKWKN